MSDAKALSAAASLTPQATLKALERLEKLGLVSAVSARAFSYAPLVALLENDLPL
jgi:hypothetical protein